MNEELKKVTVSICGNDYSFMTDEDEALFYSVALLLDSRMKEVAGSLRTATGEKVAVLVAMQFVAELVKMRKLCHSIDEKVSTALAEFDTCREQ